MKLFRSFLLFTFSALLFTSCQKELSFEEGTSRGSLKEDAIGECLPVLINGNYKKDTLLNASNYIDVQVNITQTGTYVVKTDTLNGYSFSANGIIAAEGLNTIRMFGQGRPVAASLDVFKVKFDTSVCEVNVVVTGSGGGGGTAAKFTLNGSGTPTACTGATQTNNFYANVPTNPANTVTVYANVSLAGTYSISTPIAGVNGLVFSGSGVLALGNNVPIVLTATGLPAAAGTNTFPLNTTSPNSVSNCGFSLTTQATPAPATFSFDCSTPVFVGTYQAGVSTSGASVQIKVTSVAGGSYSITSSTTTNNNGVIFSGSGVLAASATPQTVTLFADAGPASAAGPFTYTITGAGSTGACSITQTYSPATSSNGVIKFDIAGITKTFNFSNSADTSVITVPAPAPPGNYFDLYIEGDAAASPSQEAFTFDILKSAPYFSNGTSYNVNQFLQSIVLDVTYTDNTGDDYTASSDPTMTQTPAFSVTITSITPTQVIGTFTGPLKNAGGTTITAVNGSFNLPLQ